MASAHVELYSPGVPQLPSAQVAARALRCMMTLRHAATFYGMRVTMPDLENALLNALSQRGLTLPMPPSGRSNATWR